MMIEKVGTIKNPLTIIAIFAAIAEISGTIVLPFINAEHQGLYIWFLMIFPLVLLITFFLTLNFNHKVLYAPSDYKNEDNFIMSLQKASFIEKARKIDAEIESLEEIQIAENERKEPVKHDDLSYKKLIKRSTQATYYLAEELVFAKLAKEFGPEIQREVKSPGIDRGYIFDGVISDRSAMTIIEVKFVRNAIIHRLQDTINRIEGSLANLTNSERRNIKLLLAVVTDQEGSINGRIEQQLENLKKKVSFPIELRTYNMAELEKEFEINP